LRHRIEEVIVTDGKTNDEIVCGACEGGGWSRSASGRCTHCAGEGVLHVATSEEPLIRDGKVVPTYHAGARSRCRAYRPCRSALPERGA
jgi:DnaJ-class molecular chaperone